MERRRRGPDGASCWRRLERTSFGLDLLAGIEGGSGRRGIEEAGVQMEYEAGSKTRPACGSKTAASREPVKETGARWRLRGGEELNL
jgi:hypothetical protein